MRIILLALTLGVAAPLSAQSAPARWTSAHDSVMLPIKRLFDGMRAHDSSMIRSAFVPGALMMGSPPRTGLPSAVKFDGVEGFIAAAGRAGPAWDEQIFDPVVQIDGNLASAWVFYTFHHGTDFTHCGVDAMQLLRTADGWKITMLADTRRTTGCETEGKRKI